MRGERHEGPDGGARQLNFDFGAPLDDDAGPRMRGEMIFFAILPPTTLATELADLGRDFIRRAGLNTRAHRPERLHISLLGWSLERRTRETDIEIARELGRRIDWRSFDVSLTAAMSFGQGGARPLVLCCSPGAAWALTGLHDRLLGAAGLIGLKLRARSGFEPHLTLAYSRVGLAERPLAAPVRWTASELVLILSEQGRGRYTELGRWPFQPRT